MERIIIQLPERALAELDRVAGETGVSRAAFAREAIELALAQRRRDKEVAAIIRSFTGTPPGDLVASKSKIRRGLPR